MKMFLNEYLHGQNGIVKVANQTGFQTGTLKLTFIKEIVSYIVHIIKIILFPSQPVSNQRGMVGK